MAETTTWRKLLDTALIAEGESWGDVVANTLTDEELDVQFYDGYGAPEGTPFFMWTANRVYFAVCYDGAESVASVPRNPCDEPPSHVGGW